MAEEDDSQKTEEPTPKKLEKARKKGQVANSQEVKSWFILLGGAMGLLFLAPGIMNNIRMLGQSFIASPHAIPFDNEHLRLAVLQILLELGWILAPLLGLLVVLAVAGSVGQTGFLYSPSKIKPELSKISLIKGLKSKFSVRQLVEFVKGMVKISLVALVALAMVVPFHDDLAIIPLTDLAYTLKRIHEIALWMVVGTIAVMTVVSVLDFAFQKHNHMKQLRMSRQEVRDEHKQSEGDPQVKAQIRRLRTERARQRMMAAVPQADVVITNPTHFSVALEYKMEQMAAPKLVAKGMDELALRIREVAEENEVPIVENPPLARALYASVELDEEIPPEHFKAVAEVIGYVMRLRGEMPAASPAAQPGA